MIVWFVDSLIKIVDMLIELSSRWLNNQIADWNVVSLINYIRYLIETIVESLIVLSSRWLIRWVVDWLIDRSIEISILIPI